MTKDFPKKKLNYVIVFKNEKDFVVRKELATRAKYQYGKHSENESDIHIVESTGEAWQWAAINNAAYDYYCMCDTTKIANSDGILKIWNRPHKEWSSAPMLGRIVHIGSKNATYRTMYYRVSHELAHSSHYAKAGYNDYWRHYIDYIIKCSTWDDNIYGDGTRNNSGICAVGEMWGNAMGRIRECEEYDRARLNDIYHLSNNNFRRAGENDWIKPDPIWALITRGVLTKKQVYDCLVTSVNTRAKLIAKMCEKYPAKAPLIRLAFDADDTFNPTLTGPDNPALNTTVTYTVAPVTGLPANMTFDGFTVTTTGSHTIVSPGTTDGILGIRFNTASLFTITAAYTLPDSIAYTCTKTIDKTPPPLPPTITSITSDVSVVAGGGKITFTANGPDENAPYYWQTVENCWVYGDNMSKNFTVTTANTNGTARVRCCLGRPNFNDGWTYGSATIQRSPGGGPPPGNQVLSNPDMQTTL